MITVERHATIVAPAADVWAVLADFAAISAWADFVDHSCLLSEQTDGVGMVRRIQTGRTTVVETVNVWEPGVTLGYAITGLPKVLRSVTNTWRLDAVGESTDVSLTSAVDAGPRPPQQAIAKIVGRKLATSSDAMLAGIAAHLKAAS
jgi:hypothetical protein